MTAPVAQLRSAPFTLSVFLKRFGLLLVYALLGLGLSLLSDRFLTGANQINILRQATISGIVAIGMTLVILTAGIDLSVGSILALSAVVAADFLKQGVPVLLAILIALGIGALMGMFNGLMIARGKIPPFIATLGMLTVGRGLTLMYTQGKPFTGLPDTFRFIGTASIGPVPMPIVIAAILFILVGVVLSRTRFGEYIYLIGDNPVAARLAGVNNNRVIVIVYMISGMCAALAGLILIARLDSAQPVIGAGYEFSAIAAVVVGGTSFSGGEGTLLGTLLGALLIETLSNGLNLLNVSQLWEQVIKGVVIALALLFYKAINRTLK
ncbi:MAG: ribose ABC transporter permease [Anaerolinea sp.]|nr:ribose ABC transporter permease [Anaerolinea sp.]